MIGHDHEAMNRHVVVMPWYGQPMIEGGSAVRIQSHLASNDITEPMMAMPGAKGHEIETGRCIVMGPQTHAAPIMPGGVENRRAEVHGLPPKISNGVLKAPPRSNRRSIRVPGEVNVVTAVKDLLPPVDQRCSTTVLLVRCPSPSSTR